MKQIEVALKRPFKLSQLKWRKGQGNSGDLSLYYRKGCNGQTRSGIRNRRLGYKLRLHRWTYGLSFDL